MLLGNQWTTKEIKEEMKTTIQNLWNAAKAVLRGKFILIQEYLRTQVSDHNLKELGKEKQTKSKVSRGK